MIKKILSLDWKGLFRVLNSMSKRSGRSRIDIFIDMFKLYKNEGYTWLNYYTYNFDRLIDANIRRTYLSEYGDNTKIIREVTSKEDMLCLIDKGEFSKKFKDFLGREYLDLRESKYEDFENFVKKHRVFFAKAPALCGGEGMVRINSENEDIRKIYDDCMANEQYIIDEAIKQHPEMKKLSVNSVNTIRTGTAIDKKGNITIPYMVLRASVSDSYLDNGSQGGMWTLLDDEGYITKPMFANLPVEYITEENPLTGFKYIGFKIPMIEELKEMAKKAASTVPNLRYIGWDIAISENGPVLIEANDVPSVELYQAYVHMDEDKKGKVDLISQALDVELR